ncbi:helix-turn-helix domain-containing protein [Amycolatopsis cihanbeyliensis]|uniref:Helix-turn-helix protein n=1 Tax=Amycolatopsis cihanbeyliensis TaxID=1128664 RepID=A0A542DLK1_AMYCI|nr:helix-turn-helix transcriptional regulator [Amycolatopsis cihanbeyliensis]TQJ03966.1 helix-turn-helix protein [Amycolatopsis cihanbeyliensis]
MSTAQGSTLRRRRLGHELRRLREHAGRTHTEVAETLDCSQAKISKIEAGRVGIRTLELKAVLDLLDVPEDEAEPLLALAREGRQRGVWHKYQDALTTKFASYLALENEAVEIRTYEGEVVPGLLQTEGYANAINNATRPDHQIEVQRYTGARMARQGRLLGGELRLWVVLNEAVIRRVTGGVEVMREQLRHLLELAHRSHVSLQVLPFAAGEHPAMTGPFVLARFANRELDPDVVYLENQTGGLFLEEAAETRRYRESFDTLMQAGLDTGRSARLIGKVLHELTTEAPVGF